MVLNKFIKAGTEMNDQPFFSIIIPVYNRENRIHKALESLKFQSFKNFETIVVDDMSKDNSFQISNDFPLENKRVIRNQQNSERCITRNNGINIAKGQYICFLDSDDYHLPDHLLHLYNFIVSKNCPKAVFFSNAYNETEEGIRTIRECPSLEMYNSFTYLLKFTPNPQRWAVHNEIMKSNMFDPKINICEDLDTLLRICAKDVKFYQLKEITTVYVAAKDSFTHSDPLKAQKELNSYKAIFKRKELKWKLNFLEKRNLINSSIYHIAIFHEKNQNHFNAFKSSLYCLLRLPIGLHKHQVKSAFVICIYNFPIFGTLIKNMYYLLVKK